MTARMITQSVRDAAGGRVPACHDSRSLHSVSHGTCTWLDLTFGVSEPTIKSREQLGLCGKAARVRPETGVTVLTPSVS
eukprot:425926-Prymnesium_polylepis.1